MQLLFILFFAWFIPLTMFGQENIHLKIVRKSEITPYVKSITDLCLEVYREHPYLYEGTEEEYRPFIQNYADSKKSIVCLLFNGKKPIGAATGIPMSEMRGKYQQPFLDKKIDVNHLFYLGELILLKEYRGMGFGKKMYLEVENAVRKENLYEKICFCKIEEQKEQIPAGYLSLDSFWFKLGFMEHPELHFLAHWKNIKENEVSAHKMIYWTKLLKAN